MLRDGEGTVHVFPNGAIQTLANRSKDFSYYVIDLGISLPGGSRPGHGGAARRSARRCRRIRLTRPWILEPVEILGVDAFGDWSVVLKMRIKTVPLKQWEVGREFRKRLRRRFERKGSRFPSPSGSSPCDDDAARRTRQALASDGQ